MILLLFALSLTLGGGINSLEAQGLVSLSNLRSHINTLENVEGHRSRVTFTPGNDSAAQYIRRVFDSMPGLTSVAFDTFTVSATPPFNSKQLMNVVATLEAVRSPSPVLILGAHYDCSASRMGSTVWSQQWQTIAAPGADDNATGVASILELARVLSDPASDFPRDITVKFVAFASEETGPAKTASHDGSRHFAQAAKSAGQNILGMVSIDMIGFNRVNYYTAIVSDTLSAWLGTAFRRALDSTGITLQTNSRPYPRETYSDHETFWSVGYSAILLIENAPPWTSTSLYAANPYYHTSWDTLGTVNLELVRRVTEGVLAMTRSMNAGVTSVEEADHLSPVAAELYQNYPNPFNPTTRIRYFLPNSIAVRLQIVDPLGRTVELREEQNPTAGFHTIEWNAAGRASGVYFIRLETGSSVLVRKMMLIR